MSGAESRPTWRQSEQVQKKDIPLLASTVHPQVRDVLDDDDLAGSKMGEAMIRTLELQLELHRQQDAIYRKLINERDDDIVLPIHKDDPTSTIPESLKSTSDGQVSQTLFAQAAIRIATDLGQASDDDAQAVIKKVPLVGTAAFRGAVFQAVRLPYPVVNRALHFASKAASPAPPSGKGNGQHHSDEIDQTEVDVDHLTDEAVAKLGIDRSSSHWQQYMVGLGRDATQVFGSSDRSDGNITITRPAKSDLPGLLILDEQGKDQIKINTLPAFLRRFEFMSSGILKGLDWKNVMIAGGLPLAVLTSVTDEEAAEYQGSDIDMYLYGLAPEQATAKLQEIEKVFSTNLPTNESTGEKMKYAVLRNSQTVTFVPEVYPNRRLQVILKLCPNPMAVLLNFDLDQVGVAYDGSEVWMLPRTARAIITSYTVFTMDLIHGSFLSPRKATQDQRVFKYARRGYGLRFLPSYIESLPLVTVTTLKGDDTIVKKLIPDRDVLHVTLMEERERIAWWLAQQRDADWGPNSSPISMKELDSHAAISPELAERSSLSGWQHFVRHVALWEYSQMGYFPLELKSEDFCPAEYDDDPLSYQDGPEFSWDSDFTLEELHNKLAFQILPRWGRRMDKEMYRNLKADHEARYMRPKQTLRRTVMAATVEETFSRPLTVFVHLPRNFRAHIEPKLSGTPSRLTDVTLPDAPRHKPLPPIDHLHTADDLARIQTDSDFVLSYWIQDGNKDGLLTPHWQLVDRQADEIHEIMHAFRRGHRDLNVSVSLRNKQTRRFVSRRLVRPTERSEREAFNAWASRRAHKYGNFYPHSRDCAMLDASRAVVFGRFEITQAEALELDDGSLEIGADDERDAARDRLFEIVPKTAEEWLARLRDHDAPEWEDW
ncbi:hypothetical protein OC861_006900, partial [Tilletia horrida]